MGVCTASLLHNLQPRNIGSAPEAQLIQYTPGKILDSISHSSITQCLFFEEPGHSKSASCPRVLFTSATHNCIRNASQRRRLRRTGRMTDPEYWKLQYLGHGDENNTVVTSSDWPGHTSSTRWPQILSRYCELSLTYDKDILPAFQGVARTFQAERKCAYYAGLWEDTLLHDLVWAYYGGTETRRSGSYRAPSWSWASFYYAAQANDENRSRISWMSNLMPPSNKVGLNKGSVDSEEVLKDKARVVYVSTTPVGADPLGEVSAGTLVLSGRCLLATEKVTMAMDYFDRELKLHRHDDEHTEIVRPYMFEWHHDCSPKVDPHEDFFLMEILQDQPRFHQYSVSLAFSSVKEGNSELYKRVGMVTYCIKGSKDIFEQWGEDRTLTII